MIEVGVWTLAINYLRTRTSHTTNERNIEYRTYGALRDHRSISPGGRIGGVRITGARLFHVAYWWTFDSSVQALF
jgi:hypothetical protein